MEEYSIPFYIFVYFCIPTLLALLFTLNTPQKIIHHQNQWRNNRTDSNWNDVKKIFRKVELF